MDHANREDNLLKTKTVSELFATPKPPMLVEGMLIEKGLHAFISYSGVGKSFLAIELGIAVALGEPALGRFQVPSHGKVLYLGEDSPEWDVREQLRKLCNSKGFSAQHFDLPIELDEFGDVVPESGPQFKFAIMQGSNLNSDKDVQEIVEEVSRGAYKLVIIDTLSAVQGGNINDNGWMALIMQRLKKIREYAAVLILHHTTKPKEFEQPGTTGALGATAIGASLDGAISLKVRKGIIQARVAKQRAIRMSEFDYMLESDDDYAKLTIMEDGDEVMEMLAKALSKADLDRTAMLKLVSAFHPKASPPEIAGIWWKAIKKLLRDGRVRKVSRGVYGKGVNA